MPKPSSAGGSLSHLRLREVRHCFPNESALSRNVERAGRLARPLVLPLPGGSYWSQKEGAWSGAICMARAQICCCQPGGRLSM